MSSNLDALDEPFESKDIEWRIQSAGIKNNRPWASVLAYVTNRAIQQRLDDVVGKENWRDEYQISSAGILCGISIRIDGEWITKWDGAEQTRIEAFKGGLSSAEKRAAVKWGIGRYLYKLEATFLPDSNISVQKKRDWKHSDTKGGAIYWTPPSLPNWALPSEEKPVKRNQSAQSSPEKPQEASPAQKVEYGEHGGRLAEMIREAGGSDTHEANRIVEQWSGGDHRSARRVCSDENEAMALMEQIRQQQAAEASATSELFPSSKNIESRTYPE